MRRGSRLYYFALVIEASLSDLANGHYRSKALPESIVQTLLSWSVKYRCHVLFCDNRAYAERLTLSILEKYGRMCYQKFQILSKFDCRITREREGIKQKLTPKNHAVINDSGTLTI
ncbi:MAG: hypothetical protein HZA01_03425 [Nitrospinae bacterium]|nr:hypothetical protein [Nitrospinota bacterium]